MRTLGMLLGLYFLIGGVVIYGLKNLIYYDELLHAVSAQKILSTQEYKSQVHEVLGHEIGHARVPLMILYYAGPHKSYLLAGWFAIWGSSLESLRIFVLLCGGVVVSLWYLVWDKYVGKKVAVLATLLLITDPSFLLSRILDWGPLAIQDILKAVLLWMMCQIVVDEVKNKSLWWYGGIGIVAGLAIWEKFNAWWFVMPVMAIVISRLWYEKEQVWQRGLVLFGGVFAGLIPVVLLWWKRPWFLETSMESFGEFEKYRLLHLHNLNSSNLLLNYSSNWGDKLGQLWDVVAGRAIFDFIARENFALEGVGGYLMLACGYLAIVFGKLFERRERYWLGVWGGFAIWVELMRLFTPHANAIHHALVIYPFVQVVMAIVFVRLYEIRPFLIKTLVILVICAQMWILVVGVLYVREVKNVHAYWNGLLMNEVTKDLEMGTGRYVAIDWGLSLPVGFLSNGRVRVEDLAAFYEAKCQVKAKRKLEGVEFIGYEREEDRVFETYYKDCLWVD
ncbi:MAG: hypothetical protein KatS3mg087_0890 [Patescibacteria group bacterium]|nr:MAG: hypothetical protein KatS3mg087_0890 [Patescibacteria group bacterium]